MRKFILLFLIMHAACKPSSAQDYMYIGYGYNGAFTNLSGVNQVVANYNDTRPWLDDELAEFSYLDGASVSIGYIISEAFWFDVGFDFRGKKHAVSGQDTRGNYNTRELKVKNSTGRVNVGFVFGGGGAVLMCGLRTEVGDLKTKSRVFGDSFDKEKMEDIGDNSLTLKFGPTVKLLTLVPETAGLQVSLSVYYQWSAFTNNVTSLNNDLNNSNYYTDQVQFDVKPHHFGLSLEIGILAN